MHLSKSRFVAGVQCPKRLYFQVHQPDLAAEPDESTVFTMEQGQLVGSEAQKAFPAGVLVDATHEQLGKAITITRELIANREVPAIFEATFEADHVLVRVDVLKREADDSFQILEVKSSTSLKEHYLYDIGIQKHVVSQSGLKVSSACLMHLNRDYVFAGGVYDRNSLFKILELTPQVAIDDQKIEALVQEQLRMLAATEAPDVEAGSRCTDPLVCEFFNVCNEHVPPDHVSLIPNISAKKLTRLAELKIDSIHAVADDFPLTDRQRIACNAVKTGLGWVNPEIATEFAALEYPLCFMDFETIYPALPRFQGMRPYDHIPFQWSVHRLESPGADPQHSEFLADDTSDPRSPFIDSLLRALEGVGTIVVYNQSFEKGRLRDLAAFQPQHAKLINELLDRVWDLLPCVRRNVYHPDFGGSYSLKAVLPALVPNMSYAGMEVSHGADAGFAFEELISPAIDPQRRLQLRTALLQYCGQDTIALVYVMRKLERIAHLSRATTGKIHEDLLCSTYTQP